MRALKCFTCDTSNRDPDHQRCRGVVSARNCTNSVPASYDFPSDGWCIYASYTYDELATKKAASRRRSTGRPSSALADDNDVSKTTHRIVRECISEAEVMRLKTENAQLSREKSWLHCVDDVDMLYSNVVIRPDVEHSVTSARVCLCKENYCNCEGECSAGARTEAFSIGFLLLLVVVVGPLVGRFCG